MSISAEILKIIAKGEKQGKTIDIYTIRKKMKLVSPASIAAAVAHLAYVDKIVCIREDSRAGVYRMASKDTLMPRSLARNTKSCTVTSKAGKKTTYPSIVDAANALEVPVGTLNTEIEVGKPYKHRKSGATFEKGSYN